MSDKKWIKAQKAPKKIIERFPEYSNVTLQLLYNRGLQTEEKIDKFLNPDYERDLYDPFLMQDMKKAIDRIKKAITRKEKIVIYGDYDVDGVTAVAILFKTLKILKAHKLDYYIPDRGKEGYGLNKESISELIKSKTDLIITVDCGISNQEEVDLANKSGIDVIITDHHLVLANLPKAFAIINPHKKNERYPFIELSGAGVAYKLAQGLLKNNDNSNESFLKWMMDLVALGTVADSVPLIDENRTLVKYGMVIINENRRLGLNELIKEAGLALGKIKSENIAYIIVPHLNAAGRMQDARIGVELLTSKDKNKITSEVGILIEKNRERRKVQEETLVKCKEIIKLTHQNDLFLVIDAKDAHEGIAGIVAGKIKDEYGKPTILVTASGGEEYLKGTGRSIDGVNLYDILKSHKELFVKFGGHSGACGFLMKTDKLAELRSCLNKEVEKIYQNNVDLFNHRLTIDVTILENELDIDLVLGLEKMAPFGCQNEKPLFLIKSISASGVLYMGDSKQHARFTGIGDRSKGFSCILFNKAQDYCELFKKGEKVDIAGYPDISIWNGNSKIQFVLKDIK